MLRDLNYAVARYIWYRRNSSAFLCYALGYSWVNGRARGDQLSYRWFARSNVSGANSVNMMADWLVMCCRLGRSGLFFQWLRGWFRWRGNMFVQWLNLEMWLHLYAWTSGPVYVRSCDYVAWFGVCMAFLYFLGGLEVLTRHDGFLGVMHEFRS